MSEIKHGPEGGEVSQGKFNLEESQRIVAERQGQIEALQGQIEALQGQKKEQATQLQQLQSELTEASNPVVIADALRDYIRAAIQFKENPDAKIDPSSSAEQHWEGTSKLLRENKLPDLRMRYRDARGGYHVEAEASDPMSNTVGNLLGEETVLKILKEVRGEE